MNSTYWSSFESFEVLQVQTVELFPDLKEEYAQYQHRHQNIERNTELNNHRHAVGGAHGAEEQPILHR